MVEARRRLGWDRRERGEQRGSSSSRRKMTKLGDVCRGQRQKGREERARKVGKRE